MLRILDTDNGTKLTLSWIDTSGIPQTQTIILPIPIYGTICLDILTLDEREIVTGEKPPLHLRP